MYVGVTDYDRYIRSTRPTWTYTGPMHISIPSGMCQKCREELLKQVCPCCNKKDSEPYVPAFTTYETRTNDKCSSE